MERTIFASGFFKSSAFLLALLLSTSLTMGPRYASSNNGGSQTDEATETLIRHMNAVSYTHLRAHET